MAWGRAWWARSAGGGEGEGDETEGEGDGRVGRPSRPLSLHRKKKRERWGSSSARTQTRQVRLEVCPQPSQALASPSPAWRSGRAGASAGGGAGGREKTTPHPPPSVGTEGGRPRRPAKGRPEQRGPTLPGWLGLPVPVHVGMAGVADSPWTGPARAGGAPVALGRGLTHQKRDGCRHASPPSLALSAEANGGPRPSLHPPPPVLTPRLPPPPPPLDPQAGARTVPSLPRATWRVATEKEATQAGLPLSPPPPVFFFVPFFLVPRRLADALKESARPCTHAPDFLLLLLTHPPVAPPTHARWLVA